MGLIDDLNDTKDKVDKISLILAEQKLVSKKKKFKLPLSVRRKGKRAMKKGKVLAIILRKNHSLDFKIVKLVGGLIEVNDNSYKAFEDEAVYFYKKFSVVVLLEWRLTPVGGKTDYDKAAELGVGDLAQQTLIRVIEKVEVEKDLGKKKRKIPIGLIIVVLGIVIYIVSKQFGG